MDLRNFLAELKRRNVYKVAVAYAVVGWLLIQVATQVFPFFEIPNWGVRLCVLAIVVGFPIALVIAWAFELTPEGLKRAEDVKSTSSSGKHAWIFVVIFAGVLSLGLFFLGRYTASSSRDESGLSPKSIAVLPFDNLSRDPDNAYFAEGVQDEILTRLAKVADLKVISRTSTQRFKSAPADLPQIAKQLGVMHILEGSVQRVNDQVRVNVQLINATTDTHLWAEIYDRKISDIFAVESDIAKAIADTLQARLSGTEITAIAKRPTDDAEAYQLYLRGRFFWNKRTGSDLKKALGYFEESAKKDPHYALAYAGIADTWVLLPLYNAATPAEGFPKAKEAAGKAIALDPNLAEPHAALALIANTFDFDFVRSMQEFETSIKLNSNYATAHHWFGNSLLPCIGDFKRAIAELKRAVELDPLSVINNVDFGNGYWYSGQYDVGIAQLRKALELDPNFYYAHYNLGILLEASGDLPGAIAEYEKAVSLNSDDSLPLAILAHAQALAGKRDQALKTFTQLKESANRRYVSGYEIGIVYLALGDRPQAMQWFEKSYADRQPDLNTIRFDPFLKPLHGDPRFEALAEKIIPVKSIDAAKKTAAAQ